jgi:hypothetical protein
VRGMHHGELRERRGDVPRGAVVRHRHPGLPQLPRRVPVGVDLRRLRNDRSPGGGGGRVQAADVRGGVPVARAHRAVHAAAARRGGDERGDPGDVRERVTKSLRGAVTLRVVRCRSLARCRCAPLPNLRNVECANRAGPRRSAGGAACPPALRPALDLRPRPWS